MKYFYCQNSEQQNLIVNYLQTDFENVVAACEETIAHTLQRIEDGFHKEIEYMMRCVDRNFEMPMDYFQ